MNICKIMTSCVCARVAVREIN